MPSQAGLANGEVVDVVDDGGRVLVVLVGVGAVVVVWVGRGKGGDCSGTTGDSVSSVTSD